MKGVLIAISFFGIGYIWGAVDFSAYLVDNCLGDVVAADEHGYMECEDIEEISLKPLDTES